MTDTPDHIRRLQLQIWLAKSPAERLLQAVKDNEDLFLFWKHAREELQSRADKKTHDSPQQSADEGS